MPHSSRKAQYSPASTTSIFQLWLLSGNRPRTSMPSALDEVVIREGEALDHVADARFHDRQPEVRPEAAVGDDMDAGDLCAAEIERDPVRLAVTEGGEQSFA